MPSAPAICPAPLEEILSLFRDPPIDSPVPSHPIDFQHADFRLMGMPPHRGWPVSVCEAAVGRPLPSYRTRREWRAALPAPHSAGILLFTDAANSTFVWSWRTHYPTGHGRYVEIDSRTRMDVLHPSLFRLPEFGTPVDGVGEIDPAVAELLVETAGPGFVESGGCGNDRFQRFLDRIEETDDPDSLRSLWRKLRRISVMDPDCADGAHLLKAAGTLEIAFVAVIERMRGFVEDSSRRGDRRRPEHLRDMRALSEEAEGRQWERDTRRFVRRLIVQQNLFVVAPTRSAGRTVARDLLGFAGVENGALPALDCNVWRVVPEPKPPAMLRSVTVAAASAATEPALEAGTPAAGSHITPAIALTETFDLHRKAWEMVRRVRLAGGDREELRRAASRLERRRALLRRQLREIGADIDAGGAYDSRFCRPVAGRVSFLTVE